MALLIARPSHRLVSLTCPLDRFDVEIFWGVATVGRTTPSERRVAMRRVLLAVTILVAATRVDAVPLDVPGSVPGTTATFGIDGGLTVGTYQPDIVDGSQDRYGFLFDGASYTTFGPDPDLPTQGDIHVQVHLTDFDAAGGIAYYVTLPRSGEAAFPRGEALAFGGPSYRPDIATYIRVALGNPTVVAPDGTVVRLFTLDVGMIPIDVTSTGPVCRDVPELLHERMFHGAGAHPLGRIPAERWSRLLQLSRGELRRPPVRRSWHFRGDRGHRLSRQRGRHIHSSPRPRHAGLRDARAGGRRGGR